MLKESNPSTVHAYNIFVVCVMPLKGVTPKTSMIVDRLLFQSSDDAFSFLDFTQKILNLDTAVYPAVIEYPVMMPEVFIDPARLRNYSMSFRLLDEHGSTLDMEFKMPATITIAELPLFSGHADLCKKCKSDLLKDG